MYKYNYFKKFFNYYFPKILKALVMDSVHRNIIRKLRVFFVKNLRCLEEILDILESEQIVSENQRHFILSGSIPADKIRQFLDTIVRCGPKAYDIFKSCLLDTNQNHILQEMSDLEEQFHNVCSQGFADSESITNLKFSSDQKVLIPDKGTVYPLKPYIVRSSPHGYVLIINIEKYIVSSGVASRIGSSRDVEKLKSLFEDFHYSIGVINNPTAEELKSSVTQFVNKPEHASVDAAGFIILAHGLEHHIIASDGLHVDLDDLINCFTNKNFSVLAGKPKFIIIQACRGEEKRHSRGDKLDSNSVIGTNLSISLDPSSWLSLPHMSDCVIVYSTLPGFVSWRSEVEGSWYIRVLVEVFRLHGHRLHILELLTEINNRLVNEASSVGIKQISQPVTTLTKPFYLSTLT